MSDTLNLGAGEKSPAMPKIPPFLRRDNGNHELYPSEPPIAYVSLDAEPVLTPETIIDTIRKLTAKRDKIDESIVALKDQLITMVKKL